ncbi:hypothetical protein FGSG_12113 [Fusarium graminearum PH-1]|uniref:Chromosome 1, complete genome n=1 Tax=Gibberella zeae (strain ATCC MYA-4620 / CBS 123657 / FGSC 9075 / NRRL 31084 / PH-1) TaxID=229533 RepID=I1S5J2_GIBZE|nr:hypothetical protein FGSG_12113 [Fusarium graminearum PH-1]ESU07690.1 hypothetical protein FGSG_12113 [Fusarium graminearum PH-1]CEF74543.1 unnamed protein product [Fusarium graminearum]|eukprot:XP_011318175.1 hypothetical protein FGSG_12113 [Fusarium graminearum PH-1]
MLLNDGIRRDKVDENATLHPNSAQKWYYIPDQNADELIVFRNSHSKETLPYTNSINRLFSYSCFQPEGKMLSSCQPRDTSLLSSDLEVLIILSYFVSYSSIVGTTVYAMLWLPC